MCGSMVTRTPVIFMTSWVVLLCGSSGVSNIRGKGCPRLDIWNARYCNLLLFFAGFFFFFFLWRVGILRILPGYDIGSFETFFGDVVLKFCLFSVLLECTLGRQSSFARVCRVLAFSRWPVKFFNCQVLWTLLEWPWFLTGHCVLFFVQHATMTVFVGNGTLAKGLKMKRVGKG